MMAQVTAAAVASEMKTLAHPAGVDTIPTSANKEDHVSMSMTAALKAERSVSRAREVIAIEILCACQAIDLLAPLALVAGAAARPRNSCDRACRCSTTIARRRPTSSRSLN